MKPTLLLLAAGMGSRYGGLKQLDGLGPNGETIMDYSIYDAVKAGFGKIVFVIRKDFEQDFREKILAKYEGHVPAELVFQSLDALGHKPRRADGERRHQRAVLSYQLRRLLQPRCLYGNREVPCRPARR